MGVEYKGLKMAEIAMNAVKEMIGKSNKDEYLRRVKGLGNMIIQNGLAGTVLFIKKKGPKEVLEHLDRLVEFKTKIPNISEKIVNELKNTQNSTLDSNQYLEAQSAALEGVKWLRRYADIFLGGEES